MNGRGYPLLDGFDYTMKFLEKRNESEMYEKEILTLLEKEERVFVSNYISSFSVKEKRRFLGLLKNFTKVKITYWQEENVARQCLIKV